MVLVLGLGLWLAFGPASGPKFDIPKGATKQDIRIGNIRGVLATINDPERSQPIFRIYMQGLPAPNDLSAAELQARFGPRIYAQAINPHENWIFRKLHISSWVGVVWLAIGFTGQLAFSGRMVLQWITSERRRQSIITESFWWFSLIGSVLLFSYFVWRQEPIGILGQASGVVIYARNLRLIYKQKRRAAREAPVPAPAADIQ